MVKKIEITKEEKGFRFLIDNNIIIYCNTYRYEGHFKLTIMLYGDDTLTNYIGQIKITNDTEIKTE